MGIIKSILRDIKLRIRYSHARIDEGCRIDADTVIGNKCHIFEGCVINRSSIGDYSYISYKSVIQNASIGRYCSIGREVIIVPGRHDMDAFSTAPLFWRKRSDIDVQVVDKDSDFQDSLRVEIGNDVWVGARAIIMDGVHIGNGAVVGAGAVVTRDVAPYEIVAGVPAKRIRMRKDEKTVSDLLESEWWLLEPEEAYRKMSE